MTKSFLNAPIAILAACLQHQDSSLIKGLAKVALLFDDIFSPNLVLIPVHIANARVTRKDIVSQSEYMSAKLNCLPVLKAEIDCLFSNRSTNSEDYVTELRIPDKVISLF